MTGDHARTAAGLARRVGIGSDPLRVLDLAGGPIADRSLEVDVIARARPTDKVCAVQGWQAQGHVVAMTGDGVNDGPALRRADIGVAMGERGSEVARQSAQLVLRDDELGTLVAAIEEGRRVYDNIRRFLLYGLSGGLAEILVMLVGPWIGVALPLLPAQILWVNLVTHSLTGTALGSEPVEPGSMRRPPRRPAEGVLGGRLWWQVAVLAVVVAAVGALAAAVVPHRLAQSTLMLALSTAMLGVAWGSRVTGSTGPSSLGSGGRWATRLDRHLPANPALAVAVTGSALLLIAAVSVPSLQDLLGTRFIGIRGLSAALVAGGAGFGATRWLRRVAARPSRRSARAARDQRPVDPGRSAQPPARSLPESGFDAPAAVGRRARTRRRGART